LDISCHFLQSYVGLQAITLVEIFFRGQSNICLEKNLHDSSKHPLLTVLPLLTALQLSVCREGTLPRAQQGQAGSRFQLRDKQPSHTPLFTGVGHYISSEMRLMRLESTTAFGFG